MKTHVGVDLHQRFCYLTAVNASGKVCKQGQVVNEGEGLRAWLRQLPGPRQVVVEASGFWPAFARAAGAEAARLVMVHPQRVKAIASAKLKNDRVDSETLAHLSRCDLLPEAWMADEATQQLRLLVRLRITLGRQRARASYAGLTPVVRESAGKRKRGGITHQGSNTLRWIMLQVAQVAARYSPGARSYSAGLRARKPAQVAKIALARKLLTVVWALLRHGVCFDEELFARG